MKLEWVIFYERKKSENLDYLLDKFEEISLDELGTMKKEKENFIQKQTVYQKIVKPVQYLMNLNKELK